MRQASPTAKPVPPADPPQTPSRPSIWLLLGDKRGDNGQVETIAAALESRLGWHCEHKHLQVREPFLFGKARVAATLYHIDTERSAPLQPPWPDMVITIGRSPANVALWIKQQSHDHTRLVLVGKPSGYMQRFDLIITSAETLPAPYPNVLRIRIPLMRIDQAAIEQAACAWQGRFADLPRPLVAIMVGGPTNPFVFNHAVTDRLVAAADRIIEEGGTPYFTNSRRTPAGITAQLKRRLTRRAVFYDWNDTTADNPYRGLLGLADRFIVTGDSISMMVEVIHLKKPLQILPLPTGLLGGIDQLRRSLARWLYRPADGKLFSQLRIGLARLVFRSYLIRHTRHYPGFHRLLVDLQLATWLGEPPLAPAGQLADDMDEVLAAIRRVAQA
jgi:mitochondrial fission protein ELM1